MPPTLRLLVAPCPFCIPLGLSRWERAQGRGQWGPCSGRHSGGWGLPGCGMGGPLWALRGCDRLPSPAVWEVNRPPGGEIGVEYPGPPTQGSFSGSGLQWSQETPPLPAVSASTDVGVVFLVS